MQEKKLFLLDAYALIYRSYYAFIKNPRINSKGVNTSAIFGFVNTLEDVLKKENPSHIAVGFDPSGPTFRHEAYELYKAQREETPEVIRQSVPIIKEIIKAYNIPIIEVPGFEADDVIGTLAKLAEKEGFDTYMMTPDKDYGQLVSPHIFIYKPKFGGGDFEVRGVEEIKQKFSIERPEQVIDILGLMGDASDNIPGCPGVGEKTAIKLVNEFGSIENLLCCTDQLKGALRKKVEENKQQIEFSKFLATIKTDVPIIFNEKELLREAINEIRLREIFEELEFRNLADRVLGTTVNKTTVSKTPIQASLFDVFPDENTEEEKYSILSELKTIEHDYQIIDNENKISDLITELENAEYFAFDTETTGIDPISAELVGMSFALQENKAFYVPIPTERDKANQLVNKFKNALENTNSLKIGQNIKYDYIVLRNYGITVKGKFFDTMVAHYLLQPEQRHNMDYLAEIYLKYKTVHIEELIGPKGKNQLSMRQVPIEKISEYAAEDADITLKLKNVFEKELKKEGLEPLFYSIEMPLIRVLAEMEITGVRVDTEALRQSSILLTEKVLQLEQEIYQLAGTEFNVSSARQVGEVLFERLKIDEKAKKTKTGQYSTTEEILEKLRSKHPIVGKILEQRGVKKLLSTYVNALPELINPKTGKIHTSFNQTVTATGRLSSSNPNLQNIPIRDSEGREIRRAFIPDDRCLFFSADYSQIELRIMADLSEDPNMIEAFTSGKDIHAATAAKIYKIPIEEVTPNMRRKAKTANFGIIYGISVFGLSDRLNIPRSEAKELINGYFETYPHIKEYMDKSIQIAREKGYVETISGRKRMLPDINSKNSIVRGYAERNAINAPIQGSAADIIKIAMVRIFDRFEKNGLKARMILQVHDELNFSVPENEIEIVEHIVKEEMENAYQLKVPLIADSGIGKNWLEAH
ncbi:DNA polymerase I [Coprobacter fastidiosus]|uniref:DNA polymerase I n=1 Tax=Coprobacter fastidiosus NSB1 = JCM 33896 TaxID=1349822 RepID=A0A495WBU6_9BACT|nr:DNA polymerase I [Coprobacter fastidiosus]ERM90428.1 DNA polymerase I [Coprobacter fastidiosus NSB1 = JCM 33896]RKT59101.1 DNA polymerase I [Coprobacter fastidiosus NSB1 = JCM 33896]BEG62879.1 DNA polymerase I [Coprobacter fastidiosus]